MEEISYPQFISNLPCGKDYTEGKSQERLAVAIAEHITSSDSKHDVTTSRLIGLKGEWGTGKSNVLKLLDKPSEELQREYKVLKQLKEQYYIFEYDAWGHQEDLQRRSFLETMTEQLLNNPKYNDYLSKNKKVTESWDKHEKITWDDKLEELLAHKRITKNNSIPVFNGGAFWTALFLSLTPISVFVSERLEHHEIIGNILWLVVIAFCPIILGLLLWGITCFFNKDARHWGYLLKISKDTTTKTENHETINEDEPTVAKFNKWMKDLSDYISEYQKHKLIVVYDNMDRLPADKVKELWSSIHTFFAENGFKNIWVVIPFDERHLSCAFGESDEKEQLTKHFISKTFPVVYRVTPPVDTDYIKLFDDLYSQAFGGREEKDKEMIYRILRLEKPTVTIREMIEFINSLVALKQIWKDEIDLLYCAIFKLKEKEIIDYPIVDVYSNRSGENDSATRNATIEEEILSGYYLGHYLKNIVPNDETLQTNISALVYGVSKKLAEQIPMKKYIESCFNDSSNDINKHSQSPKFTTILQKAIQSSDDAKTDSIIKSLSKLNTESFTEKDKSIITNLWDELAKRKEALKMPKQEFDDSYKSLLLNVSDRKSLVANLCKKMQFYGGEGQNMMFSGGNYYNALKSIQNYVSDKNIEIDITQYLNEIKKDAKIFVDYVQAAKDDYKTFKLSTDNEELNSHFKENKLEDLSIIPYIKEDTKYKFEELKQHIETFISTDKLDATNFKPILDAYKSISDEKPLKIQLTLNQRNNIWNSLSNRVDTNEYAEIAAIQLANNINIAGNITEKQIQYIAGQIDYYGNYGDLLVNSSNNQNLNKVLQYMTKNKMGCVLSLVKVSPHFFNIKNKINVKEDVLLNQLNDKGDNKADITPENIQIVIPKELYQFTKETHNDLANHINETAIKALSFADENTIYNQLNQPNQPNTNNYWYKVIENLIDTDFSNPLPENIFNIGIRYLKEVASNGTVPQENSVKAKIIEKLEKNKTGATIEELRNIFCNSQSTITEQKFQYLENWLRKQGNLTSRATEVVHHIIDPIINDKACLKQVADNAIFYADLFKKSGNNASSTKQKIEKIINGGDVDEKILEFGKLIGINNNINSKQE